MHLLEQFGGQADYIMFSDQDDVWHPDKVRLTLRLMEQAETDPALPVLVHTDLRVVDGQLHEMDPSFQHYSGLDGHRLALEQLLVQKLPEQFQPFQQEPVLRFLQYLRYSYPFLCFLLSANAKAVCHYAASSLGECTCTCKSFTSTACDCECTVTFSAESKCCIGRCILNKDCGVDAFAYLVILSMFLE